MKKPTYEYEIQCRNCKAATRREVESDEPIPTHESCSWCGWVYETKRIKPKL